MVRKLITSLMILARGWNLYMRSCPDGRLISTKMTSEDEFPEEFNAYVTFLEEQLETPIKIVSVGPDRDQTIERYTEE